jgi:DNA-binding MarR family transcriptional regulator
MSSDIQQVRRFNREVTQRIGVLHDQFLGRNRPLGESRLLFEIGPGGREVRALRTKLGLDSGYVSRLLRSLEKQGLVETIAAPRDARLRIARLTSSGLKEREVLDRRSDDAAASLLSPLGQSQRQRLLAAMAEVESLLGAHDITIAPEPADSVDALWCLDQYYAFLDDRFEEGYDPAQGQPTDAKDFSPPKGVFLIARMGDKAVGCGALKSAKPGIGELKRLWVAHSTRGLGLGQRLLSALEDEARKLGLETIRLDTNRSLTEAKALYLKDGYVEVPRFNDDPYPDFFFEKRLD